MLAEVIPDAAASPGELRAPGAAARLPWSALLALALLVGCVGVLCAAVVHSGCVNPGPPVSRPDPGTPRAGYCETMDDATLRAALVVVATALVVFAGVVARRRPLWPLLATALVILALLANAVVAKSLTFAYTI
jgi:hypothetical protein